VYLSLWRRDNLIYPGTKGGLFTQYSLDYVIKGQLLRPDAAHLRLKESPADAEICFPKRRRWLSHAEQRSGAA
jgi:hypothetical protein